LQYIAFDPLTQVLTLVAQVRIKGTEKIFFSMLMTVIRGLATFGIFKLLLRLRATIGKNLNTRQVDNFVIDVVLVQGVSSLVPMAFFNFEAISCLVEFGDFESCEGTTWAALWLSCYIIISTAITIAIKSQSRAVQNSVVIIKEQVVTFNFHTKEMFQMSCLGLSLPCALFQMSSLGVPGNAVTVNIYMGLFGLMVVLAASGAEFTSLVTKSNELKKRASRSRTTTFDAESSRHLDKVDDDGGSLFTVGAFV